MVREIQILPSAMRPIAPPSTVGGGSSVDPSTKAGSGPSFQDVLKNTMASEAVKEPLRFSAHAQKRLESRDINLSEDDLLRLTEGVNQAGAKGSRDSLVMVDQLAFVVSVPNRTVVTAVDVAAGGAQSVDRGTVFTQIDSAVFA